MYLDINIRLYINIEINAGHCIRMPTDKPANRFVIYEFQDQDISTIRHAFCRVLEEKASGPIFSARMMIMREHTPKVKNKKHGRDL